MVVGVMLQYVQNGCRDRPGPTYKLQKPNFRYYWKINLS